MYLNVADTVGLGFTHDTVLEERCLVTIVGTNTARQPCHYAVRVLNTPEEYERADMRREVERVWHAVNRACGHPARVELLPAWAVCSDTDEARLLRQSGVTLVQRILHDMHLAPNLSYAFVD